MSNSGDGLVLTADDFHPLMKVSPVMLLGDFSVTSEARGFAIGAPAAPGIGDVNGTAMPFYAGEVEYTIDLATAAVDETFLAKVPFAGSYAELTVAGPGPAGAAYRFTPHGLTGAVHASQMPASL